MENKKNKRKLFKRIGAIVGAVALTIVAFSLPFLGGFNPKFNSKNLIASADSTTTSYSFVGSDLYYFDIYKFEGQEESVVPILFKVSFFRDMSTNIITVNPQMSYINTTGSSPEYMIYRRLSFLPTNSTSVVNSFEVSTDSNFTLAAVESYEVYRDYEAFFYFNGIVEGDFSCDVSSIQIGTTHLNDDACCYVKYYDDNGNSIMFYFYTPENFRLDTRTYYLNTEVTESQAYRQGYNEGLAANQDSIYSQGYQAGESVGYNNGYSAGVNAAGNYTFTSLISAVIDVPVKTFMSLFNFELLGVNLAGFFTGLLTICFIITIVRLIV